LHAGECPRRPAKGAPSVASGDPARFFVQVISHYFRDPLDLDRFGLNQPEA